MFLNIVVLFFFLVLSAKAVIYELSDDAVLTITCGYEDECAKDDIIIQAESGYKVLVTVIFADIDGSNGDYLLIKGGTTIDDGLTGMIFTHQIKQARKYVSFSEEVLIRFVVREDNESEGNEGDDQDNEGIVQRDEDNEQENEDNNHRGYILTAEHYGERITTLPPTTTERPWPTPSDEDIPFITVNVTVNDFANASIASFQEIVAELATEYVSKIDMILEEPISPENVQVNQTMPCPTYLPNAESCLHITFALPVLLAEDSEYYGTYQLNHTHLERMWANAEQHMVNSPFDIYRMPNNSHIIAIWISIFCCIALLYGVFYFVSGYECTGYIIRRKKREDESKQRLSIQDNDRKSITSMSPPPFQPMPALFDSDVTYYDPDSPVLRNSVRTELDDSRDTLDSANLNVRTFSFNGQNLEEVTET